MGDITKLLQIKYGIIQAPMAGGAVTPQLVAAVSQCGGLGSLASGYVRPDHLRQRNQTSQTADHTPVPGQCICTRVNF
ncbi:nitronate monooxygenase [Bacillus sp. SL00103]